MIRSSFLKSCLFALAFLASFSTSLVSQSTATPPWERAPFSADPKEIAAAAAQIKPQKYATVTILTEERRLVFDSAERAVQSSRLVFRIEEKESLLNWGTVKATWSPWRQKRPVIRARVIAPDGTVSMLDPKILTEAPAHDQRPEIYEDQRSYSGPLPNVVVGSLVEEETVWEDTAPTTTHGVMRRFYVGNRNPTLHTSLELQAPASLHIRYKLRETPSVKVTRTEQNGLVTLLFEQGAMEALESSEKDLPSDFETWPLIDYSTGESWKSVAEGYYKDIESAIRPQEVTSLLEGTAGLKQAELLQKLVTNLHQKVRYTGLEFGSSALIPKSAGETLKTGYGDCKDKAIVLVSALRAAGINAQLALLDTRNDQDVSPELAGLGVFDHAIVYIPGQGGTWIDATAEFFEPGDLPWADQGRLALLIGPGTKDLTRTPINTPAENIQRVRREFQLAEYGPARITETFHGTGQEQAILRRGYGQAESKETREGLERYVKNIFLAEALTDFSHNSGSDLTKPFELKIEIAKGRRGLSDMTDAIAAIRVDGLFWGYPDYITSDDGTDKPQTPGWKPRKNALEIQPFATEWTYKVVPPPGFQISALPKDSEQALGPAKLSQKYSLEKDGSVAATWRFDSGKARYTPAELKALQQALHKLYQANAVMIDFRQKGAALLAQGKAREALAAYADLIKLHPSEGLHHLQIANALLSAGFGEEARKEAHRATELDPKNALGWSSLGWILEHDMIGRRFGKGFDLTGGVAAYRKAIELDPKEWSNYADLAILLEYDSRGDRYTSEAKLDEAIAEYRELKKVDKDKGERYDDNLLYALYYAKKWDEVLQHAGSLSSNATREALSIAAMAARDGSQTALAEATRRESNENSRSNTLVSAADMLIRVRMYPPALDLLKAAAAGQEDSSKLRGRIEMLEAVQPYEKVLLPEHDPKRIAQQFFVALLDPRGKPEDMVRLAESDPADAKDDLDKSAQASRMIRKALGQQFLTEDTARDLIVSNLQIAIDGDEKSGYRIRARGFGDKPQTMLVARGRDGYKIFALDNQVEMAGKEVLRYLDAKDLRHAKQWLDWAREEVALRSGDDTLAGDVFPRFWTRGDDADEVRMRVAALSLLSGTSLIRPYIDEVKAVRALAKESDAVRFDLLLAHAAAKLKDWQLMQEVAPRLFAASPSSDTALRYMTSTSIFGKDRELGQKAVTARLARIPDDVEAIRASAQLAESRGDFAQARMLLRSLMDKNRAEISDYNQYTWNALFIGKVTDEDVSTLQRAITEKNNNSSYAEIHTLACLYADVGKTKESRELLLQAMDLDGLDEPNEAIWYGFGRIAEEYGLGEVALSLYQRVAKTEGSELPTSTYNLARTREKLVRSSLKTSPATATGN